METLLPFCTFLSVIFMDFYGLSCAFADQYRFANIEHVLQHSEYFLDYFYGVICARATGRDSLNHYMHNFIQILCKSLEQHRFREISQFSVRDRNPPVPSSVNLRLLSTRIWFEILYIWSPQDFCRYVLKKYFCFNFFLDLK